MATIKKKFIGDKQFGGFTPYGNVTTIRATLQTNATGAAIQKHPHVRGEDSVADAARQPAAETPPRAWGRLFFTGMGGATLGNTPTCVGKTRMP